MVRSSANWKTRPGSFDALHTAQVFPTDGNLWDIPSLHHTPIAFTPASLTAYRTRLRRDDSTQGNAVHFFLDDYRFESVWSRPLKALQALRPYQTLLTPDFSLYADYPLTVQLWNIYRSRWCGAFWQLQGFQVIPSVAWSTPASFDFCFAGLPQHSLVAISSIGVRRGNLHLFAEGYRELIVRAHPSRVLCYGKLLPELESLAEVKCYPTQMEDLRRRVA